MSSVAADLVVLWVVTTVTGAAVLLLVMGVQRALALVRRRQALRSQAEEPRAHPALG